MKDKDFSISTSCINGTIHIFSSLTQEALPKQDYEMHSHYQHVEVYYFLEGDLELAFEGKHIKVENGGIIVIANGVLHRPIIKSKCRYYRKRIQISKDAFIHLNAMALELYDKLKKRKIFVVRKETVERTGMETLFCEIENYLAHSTTYHDFCALINLFSLLIKAEHHSEQHENMLSAHNEKITQIIRYIDDHLSETLSYKLIAEAFHLSEKSLYKFFKNETGFSLGNYINERRIIMAQSLLNKGESATSAAFAAGFKDYSVFYRCFLKNAGITPAEYIKTIVR